MSKSKKKRLKRVKKPKQQPVTPVESEQTPRVQNVQKTSNYTSLLTYVGLAAIFIFALLLRGENFSVWKKNAAKFQYQGEYQMANFDSYFYLQAAKDLKNGTYDEVDERRRVPNGMERSSIPPLLSLLAVGIHSVTGIPLASVAISLPVILASLLAVLVFFLSQRLGLNNFASLLSSLFAISSLTYVARTRVGVFDTDSLNVIFPLLTSYLLYVFVKTSSTQRFIYLGLSLLSTFLFFIWWNTASSVVLLSFLVPFMVVGVFFFPTPKPLLKYGLLAALLLISLFFVKDQVVALLELVLGTNTSVFPNNMDISELNAISLSEFNQKSLDNVLLMALSLIGLGYFGYKQKLQALIFTIPVLLAFSPFAAGNRFIAFSAPILAIALGHAIQLLYDYKKFINPAIATIIASFIGFMGIFSTYKTITDKHQPTAAYENVGLLDAIKAHTPPKADIWTDADIGYQIQYYLDRGTFADGEFEDGEIFYYIYFPLAAENLTLSANYMKFYHKHGKKGLEILYSLFPSINDAFVFLKQVLAQKPLAAKAWLVQQQQAGKLPEAAQFPTIDEWLSFLYPKSEKDLYLFTYYKMTQTASWFKQGNSDLVTGKTKGMPLFLTVNGMQTQGSLIGNNQFQVDTLTGFCNFNGQRQSFQYLLAVDGTQTNKYTYSTSGKLIPNNTPANANDKRFAFHWNKRLGFGAAVSKELGNTTLAKLFIENRESEYFTPVSLKTPLYQLWKVQGDEYEK